MLLAGSFVVALLGLAPKLVSISAPDGFKLCGRLYQISKAGPGALLLHQGDRRTLETGFEGLAQKLQRAGFHVLSLDFRTYGGSVNRQFPAGEWQRAGRHMTDDAKAALTYLKALPLVTKHNGVVVGASIGGRKALELLVSEQGIGSVVLLSSRLNDDALGIIRESPKVAVLSVAASDDPNGGTYAAMSEAAVASEHPHSKFLHFAGVEHGAPLLKANSGLEDDIVRWLVERPGFL